MADNGANTLSSVFNSPDPSAKYALKQVYRDPATRKAYVYFVDADSGAVLNSLDGYTVWESGLGYTTEGNGGSGTTQTATNTNAASEGNSVDQQNSQIRNDGFDNPQSAYNSENVYEWGKNSSSDSTDGTTVKANSDPDYKWTVETYKTGDGDTFANNQTFGRVTTNEGTFTTNAPTTLEKSYTSGALSKTLDSNALNGQTQSFSGSSTQTSSQGRGTSNLSTGVSSDVISTIAAETAYGDYEGAKAVTSVMANRSTTTGTSVEDIAAAKSKDGVLQFSGYASRDKYPPGSEQYAMAEKAYLDVAVNGTTTNATYFSTPAAKGNLFAGTPNANLEKVGTAVNHEFYVDKNSAGIIVDPNGRVATPDPSKLSSSTGNTAGTTTTATNNPQNFDASVTPSFTAPSADPNNRDRQGSSAQVTNIAPQQGAGLTQVEPSFSRSSIGFGLTQPTASQEQATSYSTSDLAALGGTGRIGTMENTSGGRTSYSIASQNADKNREYNIETGKASNIPDNITSSAWGAPNNATSSGSVSFAHSDQTNINPATQSGLDSMSSKWGDINVTSGARSDKHNESVGGASKSQHLESQGSKAVDIDMSGMSNSERTEFLKDLASTGATVVATYSNSPNMVHVEYGSRGLNKGETQFFHDYGNGWQRVDSTTAGAPSYTKEAYEAVAADRAAYSQPFTGFTNTTSSTSTGTGFYDRGMSFNAPGYTMPNTVEAVNSAYEAGPTSKTSFDGTFATPAGSNSFTYDEGQAKQDWSSSVYVEADEITTDKETGDTIVSGNISVVVPDVGGSGKTVVAEFNGTITKDKETGKYQAEAKKGDAISAAVAQSINLGGILADKSSLEGAEALGQFFGAAAALGVSATTEGVKLIDDADAFNTYGKGITESLQKNQSVLGEEATTGARPDLGHYDKMMKEIEDGGTTTSGIIDVSTSTLQENNSIFGDAQKPSYDFAAQGPNFGKTSNQALTDAYTSYGQSRVEGEKSKSYSGKSTTEALFDALASATGSFDSFTAAGRERQSQKEAASNTMPEGVYGFTKDGIPMTNNDPSYSWASAGPNLDSVGETRMTMATEVNKNDPQGVGIGYDNGDYGFGGRSSGRGGPTASEARSAYSAVDGSGGSASERYGSGTSTTWGGNETNAPATREAKAEAERQAEAARQAEAQRQAAAQAAAAAYQAPSGGGGYTGGGPTGGGGSSGGGGGGGDSANWTGGGGGNDSNYGGFSGGWSGGYNSGSANQGTGQGVGGVGGNSPSTGSGGSGSQGGPGPASGSGGFSSGSSGGRSGGQAASDRGGGRW